jgi:hypothetical protein
MIELQDSLRHIVGGNGVTEVVRRDRYRLVQTPQVFKLSVLRRAYEQRFVETFTDDASVVEAAGMQVVAKIKSKAARPSENGTSSQSAVIVKNDVHNLSRADRAEIARRAQRGEKISF